jgi:hypothetical protein
MGDATILKINDDEVSAVREMFGESRSSLEEFCRAYCRR